MNNFINNFEEDVLADNFENKDAVLMAAAVFRNSCEYWYNVGNDENNPWHDVSPTAIDWGSVGVADLEGAVVGAITGIGAGTTGLMFGPGGAVLGFAGSVVKGALLGSAVSAIGQWLF